MLSGARVLVTTVPRHIANVSTLELVATPIIALASAAQTMKKQRDGKIL